MFLVPFYLVIAALTAGRPLHVPELALDRIVPLQSAWSLVYGSHLVFVFLPVLGLIGIHGLIVACFWVAYQMR